MCKQFGAPGMWIMQHILRYYQKNELASLISAWEGSNSPFAIHITNRIIMTDLDTEAADKVKDIIVGSENNDKANRILVVPLDVRDEASVEQAVLLTFNKWKRILCCELVTFWRYDVAQQTSLPSVAVSYSSSLLLHTLLSGLSQARSNHWRVTFYLCIYLIFLFLE